MMNLYVYNQEERRISLEWWKENFSSNFKKVFLNVNGELAELRRDKMKLNQNKEKDWKC
jgi:hypothetical protein